MPKNNIDIEIPDSKHPIKLMVSEPIQEWTFINIFIRSHEPYKKIINQLFRFTDEAYYLHCDPHCVFYCPIFYVKMAKFIESLNI